MRMLVLGLPLFCAAYLWGVGNAIVDAMDMSLERTVTSTLAGHLAVHSASARDELAVFGNAIVGAEDLGELDRFAELQEILQADPGVRAVIPMSGDHAAIRLGNDVDRVLSALRVAAQTGEPALLDRTAESLEGLALDLLEERARLGFLSGSDGDVERRARGDLAKVRKDWILSSMKRDPREAVEWVERRIAPLAPDGETVFFRYVATDLVRFREIFDRFEIVRGDFGDGTGLLFNERFYERSMKNKAARTLDEIRLLHGRGARFGSDRQLSWLVRRLDGELPTIERSLRVPASELEKALRQRYSGDSLRSLLKAALTFDDASFGDRVRFFDEEIAPRIRMYSVEIGEDIVLRPGTSESTGSALVRAAGTFRFRGLENSLIGTSIALLDRGAHASLHGGSRGEQRALELRAEIGLQSLERAEVESALFSGSAPEPFVPAGKEAPHADREVAPQYGVIVLRDRSDVEMARARLEGIAKARGLDVRVVDWREASGSTAGFFAVVRTILQVSLGTMLLISFVVLLGALRLATRRRRTELGTLRAMGASRSLVIIVLLFDAALLAVAAGGAGSAAALVTIRALGAVGIPAVSPQLLVLFSANRLYPTVSLESLVLGICAVLATAIIAAAGPALNAAQVSPVVALEERA